MSGTGEGRGVFQREPAVVTGGVMGGVAAVVTLLTEFGVIHLSAEQAAAVAAVAVVVLPILQGLVTRQWVRPAALSRPIYTTPPSPTPPKTGKV
jgi:hypothetical protein